MFSYLVLLTAIFLLYLNVAALYVYYNLEHLFRAGCWSFEQTDLEGGYGSYE